MVLSVIPTIVALGIGAYISTIYNLNMGFTLLQTALIFSALIAMMWYSFNMGYYQGVINTEAKIKK
jgi:hypothetical protein